MCLRHSEADRDRGPDARKEAEAAMDMVLLKSSNVSEGAIEAS